MHFGPEATHLSAVLCAANRCRSCRLLCAAAVLVVELVGASSLTGMEYLRFRIYADAALHPPMAALVASGSEKVSRLQMLCEKPRRLLTLLRVLVHAHVLNCTGGAASSKMDATASSSADAALDACHDASVGVREAQKLAAAVSARAREARES